MANRNDKLKFVAGLLAGGLAGAALALLLAPRSGQETRTQVRDKSLQLKATILAARQRAQEQGASSVLKQVSNWGNYPKIEATWQEFEELESLREIVQSTDFIIPRGMGRCYGDSALAPHIISTLRYNKFLAFDDKNGTIRCQAGVTLTEILEVIVPRGWFLPVTPGTRQITVGGAIASDVHGKSQHKAGNFSDHLLDIELMRDDGTMVRCSKEENTDLFWTTCGGMGLTGVILNATLHLIPIETAYIRQETVKAKNLDHMMDLFEQSEPWTYSVAWVDCLTKGEQLGRGILMRGEHATLTDLEQEAQRRNPLILPKKWRLMVPFNFPNLALNSLTVRAFNFLMYNKHPNKLVKSIIDYDAFFYPLDAVYNWNRIYGRRGFTQYQFILPTDNSRQGLTEILSKIAASGLGSFLAVLKLYGKQNGYLPFAMEGYSLALDFPITDGLFDFLDELDDIVLGYGGRLYLTKDVRMNQAMFMSSYPQADRFVAKIRALNHNFKFRSLQSDRIGITQWNVY